MEEQPLISVIVPVYNMEDYLNRCIDSLIHQTYSNIELLLVDDGSTDNSPILCDSFAEKDLRVKVFHLNNHGVAAARNYALKQVTGEYISFVDPDDYVSVHYLQRMYDAIAGSKASIVTCHSWDFEEDQVFSADERIHSISVIKADEYDLLADYRHVTVWGALYESTIISDLLFDPLYKVGEDTAFFVEALTRSQMVIDLNSQLYFYFKRNNSLYHRPYDDTRFTEMDSRRHIIELFSNNKLKSRISSRASRADAAYHGFQDDIKANGWKSPFRKQLLTIIRRDLPYTLLSSINIRSKRSILVICVVPHIYTLLYKLIRIK